MEVNPNRSENYAQEVLGGGDTMKPHYFDQDKADADDILLGMAKMQIYIPQTCLLGGLIVMGAINNGDNPCWGCEGPRKKCHGQPKRRK